MFKYIQINSNKLKFIQIHSHHIHTPYSNTHTLHSAPNNPVFPTGIKTKFYTTLQRRATSKSLYHLTSISRIQHWMRRTRTRKFILWPRLVARQILGFPLRRWIQVQQKQRTKQQKLELQTVQILQRWVRTIVSNRVKSMQQLEKELVRRAKSQALRRKIQQSRRRMREVVVDREGSRRSCWQGVRRISNILVRLRIRHYRLNPQSLEGW